MLGLCFYRKQKFDKHTERSTSGAKRDCLRRHRVSGAPSGRHGQIPQSPGLPRSPACAGSLGHPGLILCRPCRAVSQLEQGGRSKMANHHTPLEGVGYFLQNSYPLETARNLKFFPRLIALLDSQTGPSSHGRPERDRLPRGSPKRLPTRQHH